MLHHKAIKKPRINRIQKHDPRLLAKAHLKSSVAKWKTSTSAVFLTMLYNNNNSLHIFYFYIMTCEDI